MFYMRGKLWRRLSPASMLAGMMVGLSVGVPQITTQSQGIFAAERAYSPVSCEFNDSVLDSACSTYIPKTGPTFSLTASPGNLRTHSE